MKKLFIGFFATTMFISSGFANNKLVTSKPIVSPVTCTVTVYWHDSGGNHVSTFKFGTNSKAECYAKGTNLAIGFAHALRNLH